MDLGDIGWEALDFSGISHRNCVPFWKKNLILFFWQVENRSRNCWIANMSFQFISVCYKKSGISSNGHLFIWGDFYVYTLLVNSPWHFLKIHHWCVDIDVCPTETACLSLLQFSIANHYYHCSQACMCSPHLSPSSGFYSFMILWCLKWVFKQYWIGTLSTW